MKNFIKNKDVKHYICESFYTHDLQATSIKILNWTGSLNMSAVYCPFKPSKTYATPNTPDIIIIYDNAI